MAAPCQIRIEIDALGRGKVIVDEQDLTVLVRAGQLRWRVGELATLELELINVGTQAAGVADVLRLPPGAAAPT